MNTIMASLTARTATPCIASLAWPSFKTPHIASHQPVHESARSQRSGAATQTSNMVSCQQLRRAGASLWCRAVPRRTGWNRAQTYGDFHSRPSPTGRKQRDS